MSDDRLSKYITHYDLKNIKKILLDNSTHLDMNFRDIMYELQTPLMRICHFKIQQTDLTEMLDMMLSKSFDINLQDGEGRTVLGHACIAQNTDVIDTLAHCKHQVSCDPNIEDNVGGTPLFYAVMSRNPTVVATLLDGFLGKGLDINHANHTGLTSLQLAENNCDREICHLLKSKGQADLTNVNLSAREVNGLRKQRTITPKHKLSSNGNKLSKKKNKKEVSSPLVSTDKSGSLTRNRSNESVEYDGEDADDEGEVFDGSNHSLSHNRAPKLTPRERQNSFSLPDLRANSGSLVSSTPSSASFQSDYSLKNASISAMGNDDEIDEEELDNMVKSYVGVSTSKNSISLPELQLDLKKMLDKKPKHKLDFSTPTITPRLQNINKNHNKPSSINASYNSITSNSYGSISSRRSQQSTGSLTLPRIDTTPRAGFPVIETSELINETSLGSPRKGNSTSRGNKSTRRSKSHESESNFKLYGLQMTNNTV